MKFQLFLEGMNKQPKTHALKICFQPTIVHLPTEVTFLFNPSAISTPAQKL
jgi:hypothetical protein